MNRYTSVKTDEHIRLLTNGEINSVLLRIEEKKSQKQALTNWERKINFLAHDIVK